VTIGVFGRKSEVFRTRIGRHHRRTLARHSTPFWSKVPTESDATRGTSLTHSAFENVSSVRTPYRVRSKASTEHPRPDLTHAGPFNLVGQLCLLVELAFSGAELIYLTCLNDAQFSWILILISEIVG
jgi:hypothetical protein